MVVNSINFWLFFTVTLLPYFLLYKAGSKWQNLWLLLASYFFYGWADWRMLPLLAVTTLIFYCLGITIGKNVESNPKKAALFKTLGIIIGLGVLVYFKYLGFMVDQFATLFRSWGMNVGESTFSIVMPIGISFFTFKLMSYILEVNLGNIKPEKDIVKFGTYIAFFPTILSGPIDRPNKFLPQLDIARKIDADNLSEGFKRILWGMFLKMCIADRIAPWTDAVFNNYAHHNGTTIIVASILYLIQMYTDFAGYSDMAIGVARMMGINVAENFKRPFFAQNIAEYWRNWHITLTQWVTDYVFKPLTVSFRDWGQWGIYLATLINFVLIGAWHGANWTFVLFGVYHGLLLILVLALEKRRKRFEKKHNLKKNEVYKWSRRILTFMLCAIGAVLWRSVSVGDFLGTMAQISNHSIPFFTDGLVLIIGFAIPASLMALFKEWKDEYNKNIHFLHSNKTWIRLLSITVLLCIIFLCGNLDGGSFIYFQF